MEHSQKVVEEKARISTSLIFLLSGGVQQIPFLVSTLQLESHSLKGRCLKVEVFMDTRAPTREQPSWRRQQPPDTVFLAEGLKEMTGTSTGVGFPGSSYHWTVDDTWIPQCRRLEPLKCKPTERYSSWRWPALLTREVRNHRLPEAAGCVLHMQREEERNAVPIIFLQLF